MPPEDGEVRHELAPVPSTSPGPAQPSPVTSRTSQVPSRASAELAQPSPVWTSRASPGSTQPSPVVPSRASPGPAQPSLVTSRGSPGLAQPPQSQSLPLSHQFSGAGDGGEPQQLGRTRAQTARNLAGIDRSQTVNDGVAQLGCTRGQTPRNQGGMQHGLLSLMAGREGIGHVLYHQAPPPSPTLAPGE